MMNTKATVLGLLFASGIQASYHGEHPPSSTSVSWEDHGSYGHPKVHVVQVSDENAVLKYFPDNVKAEPGSVVEFQFFPRNHTVTQSSFDKPCQPINKFFPDIPGIKSGFVPVAPGAVERPVFRVTVNDTKPIWIYCGQTPHCSKGMVMAINAPETGEKTLEAFRNLALQFNPDAPSSSHDPSSSSTITSAAWPTGTGTYPGSNTTVTSVVVPPQSTPTGTGTETEGSPTGTAPPQATDNAAPKTIFHAGLIGLSLAVVGMMGL
ncbi:hypothetical protein FQN57_000144 [Myotisia sp. PD_48]|nr:hypothetical protein FQN57_000144 [Myotisia sp. PD_48]